MNRPLASRFTKGQIIVVIAAAAIGLIAALGLIFDVGLTLIQYARLKRAVDAAAISAALQYREGYTVADLQQAAQEFLVLNQVDVFDVEVHTDETDPSLRTTPRRKLVRVSASGNIRFGFLPVVGIQGTTIRTSAVGEAASIDLVLVLDASASMAFEGGGDPNKADHNNDDPASCNPSNTCYPFRSIKDAAIQFLDQLYFPYDRVAVVVFDRNARLVLPLNATEGMDGPTARNVVTSAVNSATVFEPAAVCPADIVSAYPATHCRNYDAGGNYKGIEVPYFRVTGDHSSYPSSDIGDALWVAASEFGREPVRQDSLWVVILLAGGAANTGCRTSSGEPNCYSISWTDGRICPTYNVNGTCRDGDSNTRHPVGNPLYDADDYARDAADFLADPRNGQGAVIFTIGWGNMVRNASVPPGYDPAAGEKLLKYIALEAGGTYANHGLYFFAPNSTQLREIFKAISENIATRLTR